MGFILENLREILVALITEFRFTRSYLTTFFLHSSQECSIVESGMNMPSK